MGRCQSLVYCVCSEDRCAEMYRRFKSYSSHFNISQHKGQNSKKRTQRKGKMMNNTNFINSDGRVIKTSTMVDEHQLIKITEKTPALQNIGKIVMGDINSNILTFEINRYYDGVDLYTKNIKIIVKNELGIFTEDTYNLQYNNDLLRFSWILSDSVTYKSGTITAAIIFIGTEAGQNYALKTVPFTIKIENSLDFLNIAPPQKNWFVDIESRLLNLENTSGGISIDGFETDPIDYSTW